MANIIDAAPPAEMLPPTPTAAAPQLPAMPSAPPTKEELKVPAWGEVRKHWDDIQRELQVAVREYTLNRAFDRGDQYLEYNALTAEAYLREYRKQDEAQTRTTVNKFRSRRRATSARLLANPLGPEIRASSASEQGMRRQRISKHVVDAAAGAEADDWEQTRAEAMKYLLHGGVSAVCWEWDKDSDTPPLAEPVPTDPVDGRPLPGGGPKLIAMNIAEFGVEAGSRRARDATFWIRSVAYPPEQVKRNYGLDWVPKADASGFMSPMARMIASRRGEMERDRLSLAMVTVFTRRPTRDAPGCVAHYVNGQLVAFSAWPYPHKTLNLYVFSADDPDETWVVDPWVSDWRPVQAMYNDIRSTIREHAQRAANARILSKTGSLADPSVFTDETGEVVEYEDTKPEWMAPPEIARWLVGEVQRLDDELNDLAGSPDVARGVAPGDRNSGSALALLAERADGPLGAIARDQSRGWSVITTMWLRTLRHHMPPGQLRESVVYGEHNMPMRRQWSRDDIDENVVALVPVESTTPKSMTALRAALVDMQRSFPQVFEKVDPGTLARMLGLPDVRQMLQIVDPDDYFASWENELLLTGEPVTPDEWHNHGVHRARHERLRNSPTYEEADDQIKHLIDQHIEAHDKIVEELAAQAAERQMAQQQAQMAAGMPPPSEETGEPPSEEPQEPQPQEMIP